MNDLLEKVVSRAGKLKANDIHMKSGEYVVYRKEGDLVEDDDLLVNYHDIEELVSSLGMTLEVDGVDCSVSVGDYRVRLGGFKVMGGYSLSFRVIPKSVPDLEDLKLPDVVSSFADFDNGLVLVTGPTGSGKTTTLASLIEYINKTKSKRIITVEDPVEYVYESKKSMILQRELGNDVSSFKKAIRGAMRADPDILLVGEMRDLETIESALTMAETGHLVFGTLHTRGAAETFSRLIDVFPEGQQDQIRYQIANSVRGVLSQKLVASSYGGIVPLCEVLVSDSAVANMINKQNDLSGLRDKIQASKKSTGGQTFPQGAADLIKSKHLVTEDLEGVLTNDEMVNLRSLLANRVR